MSSVMSEKCFKGDGRAHKSFIEKCKWFIQDYAAGEKQGGCTHDQGAAFL